MDDSDKIEFDKFVERNWGISPQRFIMSEEAAKAQKRKKQ